MIQLFCSTEKNTISFVQTHDGTTHLVYAELAVVHPHRVIDIAVRHLDVDWRWQYLQSVCAG